MKPSTTMTNARRSAARLATTTTLCVAALAAMSSCQAQSLQGAAAPAAAVAAPVFPKPAVASSSPIHVGKLMLDGATTETLSLFLPLLGGDTDDDSTVLVEYREAGGNAPWRQALDLFKNHKAEVAPYAGMIFGLRPDTRYDVRITAQDPDGVEGEAQQTLTVRTRALPPVIRAEPGNTVRVATTAQLNAAIDRAEPGQVILLAPGSYDGPVRIHRRHGTRNAPITLRGADDLTSVIRGGGHRALMIEESDYIHIERLHITESPQGVEIRNWTDKDKATRGNVIRDSRISKVDVGIRAVSNGADAPAHRDLFIADNVLEGNNAYGDVSNATWDDEGIVVVAESSEVAYNTISGFGDSLGFSRRWSRAVDIHHNHVLYGGDDGIELDFGYRNVAARENLLTNTGDGVSFQYIIDGPGYAVNNLIVNTLGGRGPFKIKPEAECNSGVYILNNTAVNRGRAFVNFSACGTDFYVVNNLFTGDRNRAGCGAPGQLAAESVDLESQRVHLRRVVPVQRSVQIVFCRVQENTARRERRADRRKEGLSQRGAAGPAGRDGPGARNQLVAGRDFQLAEGSAAIGAGKILPNITDHACRPRTGHRRGSVECEGRCCVRCPRQRIAVLGLWDRNRGESSDRPRGRSGVDTTAPLVMAAPGGTSHRRVSKATSICCRLGSGRNSAIRRMLSVVPKSNFNDPVRARHRARFHHDRPGEAARSMRSAIGCWSGAAAMPTTRATRCMHSIWNRRRWLRLTDASNPPAQDTEAAADGNPVSRHTYGGLAYLENIDSMMAHGGSLLPVRKRHGRQLAVPSDRSALGTHDGRI